MIRIASVTVLYNPDSAVLDSISSYASQVDKCFLIDNSASGSSEVFCTHFDGDFAYRHMGANVGIAAALNEGVRMAIAEGFQFVLTMDQDSLCTPGMVELLYQVFCRQDPTSGSVAIACPIYSAVSDTIRNRAIGWSEVEFGITSGSLIDTTAWQIVGGFDEQLFIDYVDHEYCLRVRSAGYCVMRSHDATLLHHTGTIKHINVLGFRRKISVHDADRLFYMTRNGLLVRSRYGGQFPEVRPFVKNRIFAQAVKSLIFGPQRCHRLALMIRGYRAYKVTGALRHAVAESTS